jgi:hypothetical protein
MVSTREHDLGSLKQTEKYLPHPENDGASSAGQSWRDSAKGSRTQQVKTTYAQPDGTWLVDCTRNRMKN